MVELRAEDVPQAPAEPVVAAAVVRPDLGDTRARARRIVRAAPPAGMSATVGQVASAVAAVIGSAPAVLSVPAAIVPALVEAVRTEGRGPVLIATALIATTLIATTLIATARIAAVVRIGALPSNAVRGRGPLATDVHGVTVTNRPTIAASAEGRLAEAADARSAAEDARWTAGPVEQRVTAATTLVAGSARRVETDLRAGVMAAVRRGGWSAP